MSSNSSSSLSLLTYNRAEQRSSPTQLESSLSNDDSAIICGYKSNLWMARWEFTFYVMLWFSRIERSYAVSYNFKGDLVTWQFVFWIISKLSSWNTEAVFLQIYIHFFFTFHLLPIWLIRKKSVTIVKASVFTEILVV